MLLVSLTSLALTTSIITASGTIECCPPETQDGQVIVQIGNDPRVQYAPESEVVEQVTIDVVFVLDTTGSMGGLIEGAKQKIWSIANEIALAKPTPIVRMGLIGYRDRGDEYVIRGTELTDDLDTIYSKLMSFEANGGGDTPESVNEALFNAVERFDWSEDNDALKLIFLVGDAPPQMGYEDDVKYRASCKIATEKGIFVNTIQCGSLAGTQEIWQEIAQISNGSYAAIEQSGGVQRISTPYDDQINEIDKQIRATMIDYGDSKVLEYQFGKRALSSTIVAESSSDASADRAVYNQSAAGRANYYGLQELVLDYSEKRVELESIEKEHLPEELQSLSVDELKEEVESRLSQRDQLSTQLADLAKQRSDFIAKEQIRLGVGGFDLKVVETLREQGASKGIEIGKDSPDDEPTESRKESKKDD